MKKRSKIIIGLAAASAAVLAYCHLETYLFKVAQIEISSLDVPQNFDGKKIAFASDFHCEFLFNRKRIAAVVEKINSQKPDIIILGGDYVDRDSKYIEPCFAELKKLKAPLGVYGVMGNHDYGNRQKNIKKAMADSGIVLLDNKSVWLESGDQKIKIGGIADALIGKPDIKNFTDDLSKNDFAVLASHNPIFAGNIPEGMIDLMVSGHTHGGQATFFGIFKPFFAWRYGGKYIKGEYDQAGTKILVSGGVGTTILPLRFFSRPEINVIALKKIINN